ncbi:MAG: hypothetical protein M8861_08995 [marine benthic group bacterium]|nr:hypothetical protein [Gemmatimonadota bacterium]
MVSGLSLNRFPRYLAALLVLPGFCALGTPATACAQYSVSPVILPVQASTEDQELTAVVHNAGDDALDLRVFASDYDQASDGSYEHTPYGEHPNSCAERLEVLPAAFRVPPGGSHPVTLRMKGSENPDACWSLVYVENPAPPTGTLRVSSRIGIKVYGLTRDGSYQAEIAAADVELAGEDRVLRFSVASSEDWPVIARGSVQVRDLEGTSFGEVPVSAFSVLPGHERELGVILPPDLGPGRYLAIPVLEYSEDGFVGAQVGFRVAE